MKACLQLQQLFCSRKPACFKNTQVCMYIHAHITHTYACAHACMHTYIYTNTEVCMYNNASLLRLHSNLTVNNAIYRLNQKLKFTEMLAYVTQQIMCIIFLLRMGPIGSIRHTRCVEYAFLYRLWMIFCPCNLSSICLLISYIEIFI